MYGYEKVPRPLQPEELPEEARTRIWNAFYESVTSASIFTTRRYWKNIVRAVYYDYFSLFSDEWNPYRLEKHLSYDLRPRIERLPFNKVFDFIQFVIRHPECPSHFIDDMKDVFTISRLAYVIDKGPPPTILPAVTREEGETLTKSLQTLREAGLNGGEKHLRKASEFITQSDWAESIKESIHAVESVARNIAPGAKSLKSALNELEKKHGKLHDAQKESFIKLYGYTSDEQGIRHALIDQTEANVDMDEAVFMLGACASFTSYLWRKHQRNAGN